MANPKKFIDAGVKALTPAQMKAEMAVGRARTVLPKAEREINLGNMLRKSAVKDPMYHASKADINTFSPEYRTELSSMGHHFGTADQANFRTDQYDFSGDNVNIGKYYLNIKNPLETSHMGSFAPDHLAEQMMDLGILDPDKYDALSSKLNYESVPIGTELVKMLKKNGYDGLKYANEREGEGFSYVPFESTQVKSAIGNEGSYDTSNPDITKAQGGIIKMGKGGLGRKAADKILPKVEAPSVMTRSEISDLADYIKNREGGYGLRRVERAADEIPRLGEMYTQDALRSAFSGDNARALMTMNPADFERYAAPIDPYFLKGKAYRSSGDDKMGHEDYVKHLEEIQARGGFKDVPFFEINKEEQGLPLLPFISGHEGRHRSRAMTSAGENAGLVQLLPRSELREPFPRRSQEDYIEALKREMAITGNKVLPQTYTEPKPNSFDDTVIRRPAIDLPDLYAKGGAVKMAEGGDAEQAEIDRMRLELNNSPVIQATPQTFTQRAIGTLGGYMDQAGDFINQSLEPIAESSPVKHFIGELFGDSFKSAGTALQDYTKTSRDYTEDNPYKRAPITGSGQTMSLDPRMLDVIGFADPVARLGIKAGKAGVKAAAPFAKDVGQMASEMYMRGDVPFMPSPNMFAVAPDGKPSKVLAPASDIGFYSPTEAAALNLQRKSGQGQAFLNDIMKGENVKSDEISAMGLDTFLKDKTNVTADEVQDFIAQNKLKLGETRYQDKSSINKFAMQRGMSEDDAGNVVTLARQGNLEAKKIVDEYANTNITKFQQYQLPGGENYREIVLTLPVKPLEGATVNKTDSGYWRVTYKDGDTAMFRTEKEALDGMGGYDNYQSSHWDEPNPLSHLRVSDRVTDGKKTLLVDEVQSDWHQQGREEGYRTKESDVAKKAYQDYAGDLENRYVEAVREEANSIYLPSDPVDMENFVRKTVNQKGLKDMARALGEEDKYSSLYKDYKLEIDKNRQGVPDAPYKEDWYQLTLRRAIKEAIDGGYDRVALPTGSRVAERFDLSKQIDRIDYNKNDDGTYSMSAIKGGKQVFAKEGLDENELSGIVGKDVAKKMVGDEGAAQYDADIADELGVGVVKSLTGLDLSVGGKGMKKYYDEIYPSYLNKLGKKYGSSVGKTTVDVDGKPEPLHFIEITPAMRKEFSTGIHMKRGGKVQFAKSLDAMRHELTKAK